MGYLLIFFILFLMGLVIAYLLFKMSRIKQSQTESGGETNSPGSSVSFTLFITKGLTRISGKISELVKKIWKYKIRAGLILLAIWSFFYIRNLITAEKIWVNIPPGHKGVVFNRFGGGMKDSLLGEGSSFYVPFLQSVYISNITRQSARINKITADSREFQDVVLDVNVEFSLNADKLLAMYRKYGMKSIEEIIAHIIEPNTNEAVKNLVIDYPIYEVLLAQSDLKKKLKKELIIILEDYYITVYDVDIENILISSRFRNTVAETELARARKEGEEILLEQTRIQSERKILEAENRKKLKILEAEGIAEYNKLVSSQGVNKTILELKRLENKRKAIEKWDGVLPGQTGELQSWPFD